MPVAAPGAMPTMRVRASCNASQVGFLAGWYRHAGAAIPDRIDPLTLPMPLRFMLELAPEHQPPPPPILEPTPTIDVGDQGALF